MQIRSSTLGRCPEGIHSGNTLVRQAHSCCPLVGRSAIQQPRGRALRAPCWAPFFPLEGTVAGTAVGGRRFKTEGVTWGQRRILSVIRSWQRTGSGVDQGRTSTSPPFAGSHHNLLPPVGRSRDKSHGAKRLGMATDSSRVALGALGAQPSARPNWSRWTIPTRIVQFSAGVNDGGYARWRGMAGPIRLAPIQNPSR